MIASPVFAAQMLSLGLPFELSAEYGGHPLPAGELPVSMLYDHTQFFVDKLRSDLKNIGAWDRSLQHFVGSSSLVQVVWLAQQFRASWFQLVSRLSGSQQLLASVLSSLARGQWFLVSAVGWQQRRARMHA